MLKETELFALRSRIFKDTGNSTAYYKVNTWLRRHNGPKSKARYKIRVTASKFYVDKRTCYVLIWYIPVERTT